MIVKFNDNTQIEALSVQGRKVNYQNANRDSLEFHFDPNVVTFADLAAKFGDKSLTSNLTLIDGETESLHENYTLRMSLTLKPVLIAPETSTSPAVYEDRLIVQMAQMTYTEILIAQLVG